MGSGVGSAAVSLVAAPLYMPHTVYSIDARALILLTGRAVLESEPRKHVKSQSRGSKPL